MLRSSRFIKALPGIRPSTSPHHTFHAYSSRPTTSHSVRNPHVTPITKPSSPHRTLSTTPSLLTTQQDNSEDFWAVPATDTTFWNAYVSTRPNYSPEFYRIIYDHHAARTPFPHRVNDDNNPRWALAHDVGCGAGQVAAELSTKFSHVVASDNAAAHLDVAKSRLTSQGLNEPQVSYLHSKGEDLALHHPGRRADLIAAAEAIVLMDMHAGLDSFARVLKPGGTLACWFYGGPTFTSSSPSSHGDANIKPLDRAKYYGHLLAQSHPQFTPKRMAGFKRCADQMASWLDYLDFDPGVWVKVERYKWNTRNGTLAFFGEEACGFPVRPERRVREGEQVTEKEVDEDWWRNEWDIEGLKRYFEVLFPGFRKVVDAEAAEEVERCFGMLEEEMGGQGVRRGFTWPVSLVVAGRK
ncbi:uncharacterized protein KY384_000319 [Bacidia gigantensis]|uniref:uncharacterized protein n=1 Tax=Bacidia gigantensis TaxID=2732470 RepID=UPI001D03E516|nr:uncharacterized protein KY384_000319 [Bacidia gigantensis]KAG8526326.1 hypothetical protein KY384_000319 [Bacidia gigantensis]